MSHAFTWAGKHISATSLARKLGCSRMLLYIRANECCSDCGEEIAEVLHKARECKKKAIVIDGCRVLVKDVAAALGVKEATLLYRLRVYGEDCCLTYFPGRIPARMISKEYTGRGAGNWGGLSSKRRSVSIRVGSWEKSNY